MTTEAEIAGVLPVDKPAGPTSHDIVARTRRTLGTRRIGHTGTLDPFASGLLLLCIGRATRIAEYLSGMDKRYTAVVRLGITTDTDDATGAVLATADTDSITCDDIERALDGQRGDIMQMPPVYSAKKVGGERSYALARQGRAVELAAVPVRIARLDVTRCEIPELELDMVCSSGTYVRAVARDLGAALGVGAHLTALRRTAIGPHTVEHAVALEALEADPSTARAAMMPMLDAIGAIPRIDIGEADVAHVAHGRTFEHDPPNAVATGTVALAADGELVAIAELSDGRIRPRKVFV